MKTHDNVTSMCSQFLAESKGLPLLKGLPPQYNDFDRVKVRRRKHTSDVDTIFDAVFEDLFANLRQRAIFAYSQHAFTRNIEHDSFYVFPINGYQFLYSPEVRYSTEDYQRALDVLLEEFEEKKALDILTELLRFTYVSDNLAKGIERGTEIILYGIPFFFVLRCSAFDFNYDKALNFLDTLCLESPHHD